MQTASTREAACQTQRPLIALALDDDLAVRIVIALALDHDGLVAIAIPILTLADHFTVAIAVATTGANGHAGTCRPNAHTDADVLCGGRLNDGNSSYRDSSHYKMLDHRHSPL